MHSLKNIAFTDLEMTGLDPCRNEIIEFGVIVADINTLDIVSRYEVKAKPENITTANKESLAIAGYKETDWHDAVSLMEALGEYSHLVEGAIFAAWNTPFDWAFLSEAFNKKGMKNPLDYHTLDIFTIAFEKLRNNEAVNSLKLSGICAYFGIPKEPSPHRAINGAMCAYEVYKKLRELP